MGEVQQVTGGVIRLHRVARGESLDDWAAAAGCSAPMLSLVERGLRRPGPELAARLQELVERARRGEPL